MRPQLADQQLTRITALPTGASAVTSKGIGTGNDGNGEFVANLEAYLAVPASVVGALANAGTHTFDLVHGDTVDSSGVIQSPSTIQAGILVQTGAGGVGAAATSKKLKLPMDVKAYVGVKCTKSDAHDASAVSYTFQLLF